MLKIGIYGSTGRMGKELSAALAESSDCVLSYSYSRSSGGNIDDLCSSSDVIVDFSSAEALCKLLPYVIKNRSKLVICSTGFSNEQMSEIEAASMQIPILQAANTSFSVYLLSELVRKASSSLGNEYDVEILDLHHRNKKDAPSGTALTLGKVAAEARGDKFVADFHLDGKKKDASIGFASIRGGEIFGEHHVMFLSGKDSITLSHKSEGRRAYAEGAVEAAIWLALRSGPGLYSMKDVFER
ncbi:MAG: 4-hydroxy-tetrahydrodipicolinate reductase [Rickettsiaceae bacterium]|nr:4-hydroxy-tetrahydrodipicolinate reductase [Rickettsiaceae bacterium]